MPFARPFKLALAASLVALGASAQVPFQDSLVQGPQLSPPQRGSLAGQYGRVAFGPADLVRGAFSLPGALTAPSERGAPGAELFPVYSPDSGISEWGLGWETNLRLTRSRIAGPLDYRTDDLVSPWGRLVQGTDGAFYPQGLQKLVRVDAAAGNSFVATTADGARWTFGGAARVDTSAGTYSWFLTDHVTATGRQTHLTWTGNGAGRLFLTQAQYGGTGAAYQAQLDFSYETLAQPFVDYRLGAASTLDRRVKTVSAKQLASGAMTERWSFALSYQSDAPGPAFWLAQVQQTFASGSAAPPVRYGYSLPSTRLASAAFRAIPKLDAAIAQFGSDLLQANRSAQLDADLDGRADLEHAASYSLLQQQDSGYAVTPLAAAAPGYSAACRPPPGATNPPRALAQVRSGDTAWSVVSLVPGSSSTALTVCTREGQPLATQQLPPGWALGANTRLADVNRDFQPDLVRAYPGGVQVLPNQSTSNAIAFGGALTTTLSPAVATSATWVHDFNGDGLADLVGRTDSALLVWNGLGNARFNAQAKSFQLYSSSGALVTSLSAYEATFVDVNNDGLTDVVLARNGLLTLFVNTGSRLVQTALPGLSFVDAQSTRAVVGDFAGSGEAEIAVVKGGNGYSLGLTGADGALLASVDDGRGNVLTLGYARSPATPGGRARHSVLASLAIQTAGHDLESLRYTYSAPALHSVGRFLVGFGQVVRADAVTSANQSFLNGDDFAGLPASLVKHDAGSPALDAIEQRTYQDAVYQGLPWKRPSSIVSGWQSADASQTATERADYTAYDGVCAATVVRQTLWGTLTTTQQRAQLSGFGNALHCLPQSISVSGAHADPSLDFTYTGLLTRNAAGQVTLLQSSAPGGTLTLQSVTYNADGTIASAGSPAGGTTAYGYDPGTLLLSRVTSPEGVISQVTDRDALTDAVRALSLDRGAHSYRRYFRYDGLERLARQWNDLGAASDTNPNESLSYRFASGNALATIWSSALVDASAAAARTRISYLTADGEEVTTAAQIPEGFTFGPITQRRVSAGETVTLLRPALSAANDPLALDYAGLLAGASMTRDVVASLHGYDVSTLAQVQAGVQRQERTSLSLVNGALSRTVTENDTCSRTATLDAGLHVISLRDAGGALSRFRYDALNRLREVDLADGSAHRVSFDPHGRVAQVARDGIATVATTYDAAGRVAGKTWSTPAGAAVRTTAFSYDAAGRVTLAQHTDLASGQSQTFQSYYDGATAASPAAVTDRGLLTGIAGNGYSKSFTYRADGLLVTRSVALTGWRTITTQLAWFEDGSRSRTTVTVQGADGAVLASSDLLDRADANGRLATTLLNGSALATYAYDGNGLLASASLAGGQGLTLHYDAATRRRIGVDQRTPAWSASSSIALGNRGFLAQETQSFPAFSLLRTHSYSPEGYLAGASDQQHSYSYLYDVNGLMAQVGTDGRQTPLSAGPSSLQAGAVAYQLDGLGRTVQKGDLSISYSPDGRIGSASRGGANWTFINDEAGLRLAKLSAGAFVAAYLDEGVLDQNGLVQPVRIGGALAGFIYQGAFQALATDLRGTVVADSTGAPRPASPYGDRAQHPDIAASLDYVEQAFDQDLGLVRMGVRDYDPSIARFLTPDPLFLEEPARCLESPAECNLYGYARNLPATFRDPTGKEADDPGVAEAAAARGWQARNASEGLAQIKPFAEAAVQLNPLMSFSVAATGKLATGGEASLADRSLAGASVIFTGVKAGSVITANRIAGVSFEAAALEALSLEKNTKTLFGLSAPGVLRAVIPDALHASVGVLEIKNSMFLYLSSQLRAEIDIANTLKVPFNLVVSDRTWKITENLAREVRATGGTIQVFDAVAKTFRPW